MVLAPTAALAADDHADDPSLWTIIASWFDEAARIHVPIGED